jgi:hypothetical protein
VGLTLRLGVFVTDSETVGDDDNDSDGLIVDVIDDVTELVGLILGVIDDDCETDVDLLGD